MARVCANWKVCVVPRIEAGMATDPPPPVVCRQGPCADWIEISVCGKLTVGAVTELPITGQMLDRAQPDTHRISLTSQRMIILVAQLGIGTAQVAPGGHWMVEPEVFQLVALAGPVAVICTVCVCGMDTWRTSLIIAWVIAEVDAGTSIRARGMQLCPAGGTVEPAATPLITRGNRICPLAGLPHGEPLQVGSSARTTTMSERGLPAVAAIVSVVSLPTFHPW